MYTVLLVIHIMVAIALIGIILVQRSASDGMGLSGSSSTSFMSGRSAATFITRATSILGAVFILCSLAMGIITAHNHNSGSSIVDKIGTLPASSLSPTPVMGTPASDATAKSTPAASKPQPATPAKAAAPRPE